jgi:hypothetical protein
MRRMAEFVEGADTLLHSSLWRGGGKLEGAGSASPYRCSRLRAAAYGARVLLSVSVREEAVSYALEEGDPL